RCPQVHGDLVSVVDPCGDAGEPEKPLPYTVMTLNRAGTVYASTRGEIAIPLLPGHYCLRAPRAYDHLVPDTCKAGCDGEFDVIAGADTAVHVVAHRTCGDPCVQTPFAPD